jgi:PAS domain S-box-containing protein
MTTGSRTLSRRLKLHPTAVGEGRRFIRDVLRENRRDHLCEAAELVISEVVTNALVHAGTEVQVAAQVGRDRVRVEVSDGSPHLPAPKRYADLASTGRGLQVLEQMVDRWGVEPHDEGKTVWFELGSGSDPAHPGSVMEVDPAADFAPGTSGGTVTVELLGVPLLLHSAWQMQAESLLREYLLSRLDDDNAADEIERHAAASDAMALLQEQVPAPEIPDDPPALMAAAVEPLMSAERVVIDVPRSSVPNFTLLHEVLDSAAAMADEGVLLTPPTQPEVQSMRRWLCTQVEQQSRGLRPEPWDPDTDDAPPGAPAQWDPAVVTGATTAMIAADDCNRVLAVSPAALALLGYDDASELVEGRLVDIIPHRYRQAHLAGFTLHLFAGRSALLETSVLVPALRRDGSEVTVELSVGAYPLPEGRKVFVAELAAPSRP